MLVVEALPDGRRVWISEHGYFEVEPAVGAEYAWGRVTNCEWSAAFEAVEPAILCVVNGDISIEPDDGSLRVLTYDSEEWIRRVREYVLAH